MWQKVKGKYHFLLAPTWRTPALRAGASVEDTADGRVLQTLCQKQVTVQKRNLVDYPFRDVRCGVCDGLSNLLHTSVEEAIRYSLPKESRLVVLYRALELTPSKTLKQAIERRIRKVSDVDDSDSQKEK